jgi:hypothetical protein
VSKMPANGLPPHQIDGRRELRVLDKRAIILAFRRNKRYVVQVGRQIPTKGVEKRSLRAIKVELEEVNGA